MNRAIAALLALTCLCLTAASPKAFVKLRDHRTADSDLEITSIAPGDKLVHTRYLRYQDLLQLPQVKYDITDDSNFKRKTEISGVELKQLKRMFDTDADADLVVALCSDGYRTNYPADYVQAHRPVLVLRIDGRVPLDWPKSHEGGSLGPYLISHPRFTPAFKILSHSDEPQIPYGVTRIEFRSEQQVFRAIRPRGPEVRNSPVWQGYRIAKQNCFRCHNAGDEGGRMAGRPWLVLSAWASSDPAHFRNYVRNPRAVNGTSHMPGNPQYDDATIELLRRYFASLIARSN